MNNWYFEYLVANQRHQEDISNAERYRLAHGLQDGGPRAVQPALAKWYDRWLTRLGSAMVAWGLRLQYRYDRQVAVTGLHFHPAPGVVHVLDRRA